MYVHNLYFVLEPKRCWSFEHATSIFLFVCLNVELFLLIKIRQRLQNAVVVKSTIFDRYYLAGGFVTQKRGQYNNISFIQR